MTTPSSIPAFIDQIVSIGKTAFPIATSLVQVFDGPGNTMDETGQQLWVGVSDPEQISESALGEQTWPHLGHVYRNEEAQVHLIARAWNGDETMKVVRDQAFAIVKAFTDAAVADPSFTGTVLMVRSAGSGILLSQGPAAGGGVEARVAFDVSAQSRLT